MARIPELAALRTERFTLKALRELAALDTGLDQEDACDVLANLATSDFVERLGSKKTGESMYVFKPTVGEVILYGKVILRSNRVVISFHGKEDQSDEDN